MPECELNWDGQALRVQLNAITSIMGMGRVCHGC